MLSHIEELLKVPARDRAGRGGAKNSVQSLQLFLEDNMEDRKPAGGQGGGA